MHLSSAPNKLLYPIRPETMLNPSYEAFDSVLKFSTIPKFEYYVRIDTRQAACAPSSVIFWHLREWRAKPQNFCFPFVSKFPTFHFYCLMPFFFEWYLGGNWKVRNAFQRKQGERKIFSHSLPTKLLACPRVVFAAPCIGEIAVGTSM